MCAVVLGQNRKEKTRPPSNANGYNCQRRKHRPPPDNRSRSTRHSPQGAKPDTQLTLLSRYTSPDTHLSRHLSRHTSILCGVSTPTLWCQRPDTSAPRHTQQQRPDTAPRHCPTLSPRDTLQHCKAQRRVEPPVRGNRRYAQRCRLCACVCAADLIAPSDRFCEFCMHLVNQFGRALVACRDAKVMGSF